MVHGDPLLARLLRQAPVKGFGKPQLELPAIVRAEGYHDVQTFTAAYPMAESVVSRYNREMAEWERKVNERRRPAREERLRPPERENVLRKLRQFQEQGRQRPQPRRRIVDRESR